MVGRPVLGPQPTIRRAVFVAVAIVALFAGCTAHSYLYRPVPAEMIPMAPALPTVRAEELRCLSDDAYERLANRDRIRREYAAELRALLDHGESE